MCRCPTEPTAEVSYVPYGHGEPSGYAPSGQLAFNAENSGLYESASTLEARAQMPAPTAKEPDAAMGDLSDEDLALLGELDAELGIADIRDRPPDVAAILAASARSDAQSPDAADPSIDALLNDPLLDASY